MIKYPPTQWYLILSDRGMMGADHVFGPYPNVVNAADDFHAFCHQDGEYDPNDLIFLAQIRNMTEREACDADVDGSINGMLSEAI